VTVKTRIYQICYSQETFNQVPEGFLALDYLSNDRPDWREFWPIREFLKNNHLSENVMYGFFSPRFFEKTKLNHESIQQYLSANYTNEDIVTFSPFWDLGSIFQNIFEQGDFFHGGLLKVFQEFANQYLSGFEMNNLYTHSKNNIFCNYFIANSKFWNEWLKVADLLYAASDDPQSSLHAAMNKDTNYDGYQLPMKIFIQERLATYCLLSQPSIKALNYSTFLTCASNTPFSRLAKEAIYCDALKIAYGETGYQHFHSEFVAIRNDIIAKLSAGK
jgi:hypothetical protein